MSRAEIAFIVQCATGFTWSAILRGRRQTAQQAAKFAAILLMHEEGFKADEIAETMGFDRTAVYHALRRINKLIVEDKVFKQTYLACIKHMAEMEEGAAS